MLTVYPHCIQESRLASKPVNGDDGDPDEGVFVDNKLSMPLLAVNKRWHSVSTAPERNWKNSWASCWSRLMMILWWVVRAVTTSTGRNAVRRSSDLDKSRIVFNNDRDTGCVCRCGSFKYVWSRGNEDKAYIRIAMRTMNMIHYAALLPVIPNSRSMSCRCSPSLLLWQYPRLYSCRRYKQHSLVNHTTW